MAKRHLAKKIPAAHDVLLLGDQVSRLRERLGRAERVSRRGGAFEVASGEAR